MATPLADRIREARKTAGLSRPTVAQRVGLSFKTVQNYETGATAPDMDTLSALAEALDKPVAWFLEAPERVTLQEAADARGIVKGRVEGAPVLVITVRSGGDESTHELRWVHGPPLSVDVTTGTRGH